MSGLYVAPTEVLLQVAKQHPFKAAVMFGRDQWSYTALWVCVGQIADEVCRLDDTGSLISLYIALQIEYIATAHAIWLCGHSVVFLLERPASVRAVSSFSLVESEQLSIRTPPRVPTEAVKVAPLFCSITPTRGSTRVPKSIVYPPRRSLDATCQTLVINETAPDRHVAEAESEASEEEGQDVLCYAESNLKSPSPSRSDFDLSSDEADSPSPFAFMFSSWVSPARDCAARWPSLDLVLAVARPSLRGCM